MSLELSPPVFAIFSALIEERAGLHYGLLDRPLLAEKLSPRATEQGFDSLLDYYYFLRYDPDGPRELDELVESLVVHETYFFREVDQLKTLIELVLVPRIKSGQRARVWSAACATGEEPITLALLLAEQGCADEVDIVATDISERALTRARLGKHGHRATRALLPELAERWFADPPELSALVPLRASITWQRLNLLDTNEVTALGQFDAILCRNVLIYFRDTTAQSVINSLAGALKPGGQLLVGASESLLRFGTSLRCEERGGTFFYRKVD